MAGIPDFLQSQYEETAVLDERPEPKTWLVRSREDGGFFVLKEVGADAYRFARRRIGVRNLHLATVRDAFEGQQGFFVLQEYISGETLEEILAKSGPLPKERALSYAVQLLEALEVVHREGIIHRDVTPANIIIGTDGFLRLLDFGISRVPDPEKSRDTQILGTAGYAAPEQFGFRQTDARTDLYAAGVVLNQMLTGHFPGEKLPEEKALAWIVERATALDPGNRYESAAQMRRDVRGALERAQRQMELMAAAETGKRSEGTGERSAQQAEQRAAEGTSGNRGRSVDGRSGAREEKSGIGPAANNRFAGNSDRKYRLPGFRTGRQWKKLVAFLVYAFCAIAIASFIWDAATAGLYPALELLGAAILFVVTPLFAGNMAYWDQHIPGVRNWSAPARAVFRGILAAVIFIAGSFVAVAGQGPR